MHSTILLAQFQFDHMHRAMTKALKEKHDADIRTERQDRSLSLLLCTRVGVCPQPNGVLQKQRIARAQAKARH